MFISLAKDFSPYPAGRFRTDGPNSGQRFREDFLVPALKTGGPVVVQLAGIRTCGSSFLEEAFGAVVRHGIMSSEELAKRLTIDVGEPKYNVYKRRIESYIKAPDRQAERKRA